MSCRRCSGQLGSGPEPACPKRNIWLDNTKRSAGSNITSYFKPISSFPGCSHSIQHLLSYPQKKKRGGRELLKDKASISQNEQGNHYVDRSFFPRGQLPEIKAIPSPHMLQHDPRWAPPTKLIRAVRTSQPPNIQASQFWSKSQVLHGVPPDSQVKVKFLWD